MAIGGIEVWSQPDGGSAGSVPVHVEGSIALDRRAIDSMVLKFREVLKVTERLGPQDLRTYQEGLLRPLLMHARKHASYYEKRLDPVFRRAEIDFSRWDEIPILTRAQAQEHFKDLQARELPPHLGVVSTGETSGSTGRPVRFLKNELADVASLALNDRMFRWWGLDGDRTLATLIADRADLRLGVDKEVRAAWHIGSPKGVFHQIGRWTDIDSQLDWVVARKPDYLLAYAFVLGSLAESARKRGITIRFDKILAAASVLTHETRQTCREVFGCEVIDSYGVNEFGFIACQCSQCGACHVGAESVLLEIVDKAGRPCAAGELGRVIVTSFYNYAFPLLRYEIGDYAAWAQSSENCSIKLPRLTGIVGRYRNMFTLKGGRVFYPVLTLTKLRKYLPYRQFQAIQTDYDQLIIKYVPSADAPEPDHVGLSELVREELDPSFQVRLEVVKSIERSPSGKYEDYISQIPLPVAAAVSRGPSDNGTSPIRI